MENVGISIGKGGVKSPVSIGSLLITLLRIFLGVILFAAGVAKVMDFTSFVGYIVLYDLLPIFFVTPAGYLFVSAEITLGALLILGYFSRGAALLAGVLFFTFAIALVSVIWRKLPLDDCGCENILFNWLGVHIDWKAVSLDMVLFISSITIARFRHPGYGIDSIRRMNR